MRDIPKQPCEVRYIGPAGMEELEKMSMCFNTKRGKKQDGPKGFP